MRALTSAMQELMVKHFTEFNAELGALSRTQALLRDEVMKISGNMDEFVVGARAAMAERELEQQKEAKLAPPPLVQDMPLAEIANDAAEASKVDAQAHTNSEIVRMVSETIESGIMDPVKSTSFIEYVKWFMDLPPPSKLDVVDTVMGALIVFNAVTIGFSMDNDGAFWDGLDLFFSLAFVFELVYKISLHGLVGQFCKAGAVANIFDFFLVLIDWVQLIVKASGGTMQGTPSASLFRIARLIRLARLARLLRLPIFQDLVSMITGLVGGAMTLMWAIALFFLIVYVCALLFREFFGRTIVENVSDYFDSVPRSMFTVFRCSFGDCSSAGGVPIFEHITEAYGSGSSILYCVFTFTISVGLFNVISAIFVESTMSAAIKNDLDAKQARLADQDLWEHRVAILMIVFLEQTGGDTHRSSIKGHLSTLVVKEVTLDMFSLWINDKRVIKALNDLDINKDDHNYLFDILDCDNGGAIFMSEVIDGLSRLRGEPRRSDIITVDLMVRSIQNQCNTLEANMLKVMAHLGVGQ